MQQWITWGQLILFFIGCAVVYYAAWLWVYYRHKLFTRRTAAKAPVWSRVVAADVGAPAVTASRTPMSDVHDLLEELKPVWVAAEKEKLDKEQIASAIRGRLSRYATLKETPLQGSVTQYILQECLRATGLAFTEEEIIARW
jgi:hypothetical protein